MGKVHDGIDGRLRAFVESQHVFFVATAPLAGGRVNVSPKGIGGTFVVVDEHTVAYLDITASGAETIAHLREPGNGRITLMFCSFDRSPDVVRLHGRHVEARCEFERGLGAGPRVPRGGDVESPGARGEVQVGAVARRPRILAGVPAGGERQHFVEGSIAH